MVEDERTVTLWAARNGDGSLSLWQDEPKWRAMARHWAFGGWALPLPPNALPALKSGKRARAALTLEDTPGTAP